MRVLTLATLALLLAMAPVAATENPTAPGWSALRHGPSSMPLETWTTAEGSPKPFARYVTDTTLALDQARRGIEPDDALRAAHVAMVAPRQWPLATECDGQAEAGVLLVHGLSDSPFTMSDIGQALATLPGRCLLVRSILLPGHGAHPGDLVRPTAASWQAATAYGVNSFAGAAGSVHVIGFSTGATLALDLVLSGQPTTPPVASLTLLSPSIGLINRLPLHRIPYGFEMFAWVMTALSGFGPEGAWLRINEDLDPVKAESFPVFAPRPLMELMTQVDRAARPLDLPVLMVLSADDVTVDATASLAFFRAHARHPDSRALVYAAPTTLASRAKDFRPLTDGDARITCLHGRDPADTGCTVAPATPLPACPFGDGPEVCITAISHIAVPVSPANRHYGIGGDYRNCLTLADRKAWPAFCGCVTPAQKQASAQCRGVPPVTAPLHLGEPGGRDASGGQDVLTARLGYNPLFEPMIAAIAATTLRHSNDAP